MLNYLDYTALAALSAIGRTGSFDGAARELSVTPSAISQRIKALEEKLGTVLVQRGTPCLPTPTGRKLMRHAENVGLLEQALSKELGLTSENSARTSLRIALNADSLATWFCPVMAACPDLLFQLEIDDQDHAAEWLKRGDVAAAISAQGKPVTGCDIYPLGALRYFAVAAPDYVARYFPNGVTEAALREAPALVYDEKDRLQHNWVRAQIGQMLPLGAHRLPSTQGFVEAAELGIGWGLNPAPLLTQGIAAGRLVKLSQTPIDIPLYWHVSRLSKAPLAPVTRAIRHAARDILVPHEKSPAA